jgi:hypothetical protein
MEGHDTPEAWVAFAWPYFRALQQTVVRNGTVLTTDEDNLAELPRMRKLPRHHAADPAVAGRGRVAVPAGSAEAWIFDISHSRRE